MTDEQKIKAILECYFAGFKEEIIDNCCKRICYEWSLKEYGFKLESENMSEQERWEKGL